jgi:hypothetical protein
LKVNLKGREVKQAGPIVSMRRYPEIVEKHGRSPAQYGYTEA